MPNDTAADFFVRLPDVKSRTGLSRSTIYRMVKAGDFPAPHKLGAHACGWKASDLARWHDARPQSCALQAA